MKMPLFLLRTRARRGQGTVRTPPRRPSVSRKQRGKGNWILPAGDAKKVPRDGSGLKVLDQIQFPPNTAKYGCVNPPPGRGTHPLPGAPRAAITFTTSQLLQGDALILINFLFIPAAFILLSVLSFP